MDPLISLLFLFLGITTISLVCEYIDSAQGGGYGTLLVPILLLCGFDSGIVIPAVLFTEIWSGLSSGILHHFAGNAKFTAARKGGSFELSDDGKIAFILAICGVFGGIFAALVAVNLPERLIKIYIGLLVIVTGIFVFMNIHWRFSWSKIIAIGGLAAFNKGISGGGYGPLVTTGQILVDRNPRQAVASTSVSEAIVCISALGVYIFSSNPFTDLLFLLALTTGSLASVPIAVLTVKHVPIAKLKQGVGITCIGLGLFILLRLFL